MHKESRRRARDSRLYEYGAKPLPDADRILVTADDDYVSSFSGQVALLVFLNLFGRCSRSIALHLPRASIVEPLPWAGQNLVDHAIGKLYAADSAGSYDAGGTSAATCRVHFGRRSAHFKVFGAGWNASVGDTVLPSANGSINPFGPALAAVIAATQLFVHRLRLPSGSHAINAFDWSAGHGRDPAYVRPELGDLWLVGAGSVGTAVLYFLVLATDRFTAQLFDHDFVEIHNITRSAIFMESDVGERKVDVSAALLREYGIAHGTHPVALHESPIWTERRAGTPDILVPTANEFNVRDLIETSLPPIQLYGTTGRNWQASVMRHVPLVDPCSLCLFPPAAFAPTECATDASAEATPAGRDPSLPFLSFAAGLMTAIELVKLATEPTP